jgi:hypothetical protein
MATRSVTAAAKGAAQRAKFRQNDTWEQATFIQRELTPGEQQACKEWNYSEADVMAALANLCEELYKVTFRWDDYNSCYACWLLPPKDHIDNAGMILTGRGTSSYKAAKQALYKHAVLFNQAWPKDIDRRGGSEIDD